MLPVMRFLALRRTLLPLITLLIVLPGRAAVEAPALQNGERMTFRVGWGIFMHAGEIVIAAKDETRDGQDRLLVTTTTSTRGVLKAFFPFQARSDAWFDPKDGLLLRSEESSQSNRKETHQTLTFDYARRIARYVNQVEPDRNKDIPVPPGDPMDLIMSLVETRTWNLKPGEKRDALVIFDDEFYELTLHAERYEELRTPLGTFKTLVLVPRMEKTEPKGMFKRGSTVRVWISQDERHLPVRFEVEFKFGAGIATLVGYQPPTKPAPSAPVAGGTTTNEANSGS